MCLYYKFQDRQTNMEYLRILAMFLIVLSHVPLYINYPLENSLLHTYPDYVMRIFRNLGRVGTNTFVLLTGYFSVKSYFKLSSLLKLWFITFFYSFFTFVVFAYVKNLNYEAEDYLTYIFPILYGKYWFVSCYFCLYLFSPFLNKGINAMTKKQHFYLIYMLIIWWSILPTIFVYPHYAEGVNYSIFMWFLILYIIGSYFRLYVCPEQICIYKCVLCIYSCLFLFIFYLIIIDYSEQVNQYLERNNLFLVLISISLFLMFLKIKPTPKKAVNSISVCMIGVYLVHWHPLIVPFIQGCSFSKLGFSHFLLKSIIFAILIFALSLCVEFIRRILFRPLSKKMLEIVDPIDKKIKDIILETKDIPTN